jgi:hypothetical protein
VLLLGAAIGSVVVAIRLREPSGLALAIAAAPPVLLLLAMPFAGNRAHGRARFRQAVPGLLIFSVPPLLAAATWAVG